MPTQLGKHWWPEWSLVRGVRSDYLSPTLYLSDIILLALLVLLGAAKRHSFMDVITPRVVFLIVLMLFFAITRERPWLALYALTRYLQIPMVAGVTAALASKKSITSLLATALSAGLVFSTLLAVTQIAIGRSTDLFWILGERSLTSTTPGIATLRILDHEVLRPYATFPHPNALAGWSLVALMLLAMAPWPIKKIRLIQAVGVLGVLLTMSRSAIGSALLIPLVSKTPLLLDSATALIQFPSSSFSERVTLLQATRRMAADHPILGVGPGHFLVRLPDYLPTGTWLLQPVHNVFVFVIAEFGIVGTGVIAAIAWKVIRRMQPLTLPIRRALLAIFFTALADHYWLTVQQNRILAGIIVGLCLSRTSRKNASGKQRAGENAPHLQRMS